MTLSPKWPLPSRFSEYSFQVRSQNCDHYLHHVCLSVRTGVTTRLPLDGFSWFSFTSFGTIFTFPIFTILNNQPAVYSECHQNLTINLVITDRNSFWSSSKISCHLTNFEKFTCDWKLCINNLCTQFNEHLAYSLVFVLVSDRQTDGRI